MSVQIPGSKRLSDAIAAQVGAGETDPEVIARNVRRQGILCHAVTVAQVLGMETMGGAAAPVVSTTPDHYDTYLARLFRRTTFTAQGDRFEQSCRVTVVLSSEEWRAVQKDKGEFVKDLDNWLYRTNRKRFYAVPVVDFNRRQKDGEKTITVEYVKEADRG